MKKYGHRLDIPDDTTNIVLFVAKVLKFIGADNCGPRHINYRARDPKGHKGGHCMQDVKITVFPWFNRSSQRIAIECRVFTAHADWIAYPGDVKVTHEGNYSEGFTPSVVLIYADGKYESIGELSCNNSDALQYLRQRLLGK